MMKDLFLCFLNSHKQTTQVTLNSICPSRVDIKITDCKCIVTIDNLTLECDLQDAKYLALIDAHTVGQKVCPTIAFMFHGHLIEMNDELWMIFIDKIFDIAGSRGWNISSE